MTVRNGTAARGPIEPSAAATEKALTTFLTSEEHSVIGPIRDALRAAYAADAVVPASQLAGAVDALRKYGRHGAGCAKLNSLDRQPCDCGWDDVARARLGGR